MDKYKKNRKYPERTITIGKKEDDGKLIAEILEYQKEKNFSSAADAVRSLCEDALAFKKATR